MNNTKDISFLFYEMGVGFAFGYVVGYALKKSFKVLAFAFGMGFIFMILLENKGAISVSNIQLQSVIDIGIENFKSIFEILKTKIGEYQLAGELSAGAGFLVGIKVG